MSMLVSLLFCALVGHAQTLPLQLPDGYGTLRLGVVWGEESCWLDECEMKNEGACYTLDVASWKDGHVELVVCPLTDAEGFIVKATGHNLPANALLCWAFGACNDKLSQGLPPRSGQRHWDCRPSASSSSIPWCPACSATPRTKATRN